MKSLLERGRRGEMLADLNVIDVHGHLGRYHFAIPDLSPAGLIADMDRIGVRTILCSHLSCISGEVERGNQEVLDAMRTYPGRIEGYVTLCPDDEERARAETQRRLGEGFIGVKLHNANGVSYTHKAYAHALAAANERRMPVLLHTWGGDEEFAQVRELAAEYPDASVLLAHAGNTRPEEYVRIAREFENLYLDPCASRAPRGLVEQLVEEAGVDKVLWGSDAIFLSMAQQIGRVLGAKISDDDKRQVLSENPQKLLDRIRR
jgi:predicted TIM-barrel fold metal-dependent hydrolase